MARRWVSFERVDLWSMPGAERAARGGSGEASVWGTLEAVAGVFRDSTIDAQEQAAEAALRVFAALCLLAVVCGISRAEARTVTRNFEPLARKMTDARRSHLMHSMNPVHILNGSK